MKNFMIAIAATLALTTIGCKSEIDNKTAAQVEESTSSAKKTETAEPKEDSEPRQSRGTTRVVSKSSTGPSRTTTRGTSSRYRPR